MDKSGKYEILRHYFGYDSFRNGQEQLIDSILDGRDTLGIMPTGGGKSLCFQIPALMLGGITIVVSPLISLMKDQVMSLSNSGIPSAYINSSLSYSQVHKIYHKLFNGEYSILYIAPERLDMEGFVDVASKLPIKLVAVDEAHCISEWGNDFRPSYLKIPDFIDRLSSSPRLAAFTATATEHVRADIIEKLRMKDPLSVVTGFDRPNLYFDVRYPKHKNKALLELVKKFEKRSGIIYCATRNAVEAVHNMLCDEGIEATRYHAGLEQSEREENQNDFIYDRKPVMVATNAFGMGIDKSNVGYVIHYNFPMSLEAYYQEAGRAGRDGTDADCIILYSSRDYYVAKRMILSSDPNEWLSEEEILDIRRDDLKRLNRMISYCKTTKCLRGDILDYFGQPHEEKCSNCGNCSALFVKKDITVESQKILSCFIRIYNRIGYNVGKTICARILSGSSDKKIAALGLDTLSTYGIMSEYTRVQIFDMIDHLIENDYLHVDPIHGGISLTEQASAVLFEGETVIMEQKEIPKKESVKKDKKEEKEQGKGKKNKKGKKHLPESLTANVTDVDLYDLLRDLRYSLAYTQKVPAYIIFTNASLREMVEKRPVTMEEFRLISGVGDARANSFGEEFVSLIKSFTEEEQKNKNIKQTEE